MLQWIIKKSSFALCASLSLLIHCLCLTCLQRQSLWHAPVHTTHASKIFQKHLSYLERNLILKESFALCLASKSKPFFSYPAEQAIPTPLAEQLFLKPSSCPVLEEYQPQTLRFYKAEELEKKAPELPLPPLACKASLPKPPSMPLSPLAKAPKTKPNASPISQNLHPLAASSLEKAMPPYTIRPSLLFCRLNQEKASSQAAPMLSSTMLAIPPLPSFLTLEALNTISCSNHFETEITYWPLENKEGYLFSITLIPSPSLSLPKMRQHFSFLIDRSNSVQQERLFSVKKSVFKAVQDLSFEESFNIIAFDSKMDKMYPVPMPASPSAVQAAKHFLEKIELGSFFSPANLYKPLLSTLPATVDANDLHTIILLTDGESLNKKSAQYDLGGGWTSFNQGSVSLFAIGLGGDSHLETLEAIAAMNRGKLVYSPTKAGIRRKLLKLMKAISHPIAKNLSTHIVPLANAVEVELAPYANQTPHLYQTEPYVILGKAKTLDSFVLFVQGNLNQKWLNIKKTIDFSHAKKGTPSLQTQWALQHAYRMYETFFIDHDSRHMADAQSLLAPLNLRAPFP